MNTGRNQTVKGVFAASAKPDLQGFMLLGLLIAVPTGAVLFGVEAAIRWAFFLM